MSCKQTNKSQHEWVREFLEKSSFKHRVENSFHLKGVKEWATENSGEELSKQGTQLCAHPREVWEWGWTRVSRRQSNRGEDKSKADGKLSRQTVIFYSCLCLWHLKHWRKDRLIFNGIVQRVYGLCIGFPHLIMSIRPHQDSVSWCT